MSATWNAAPPPPEAKIGIGGWVSVALRGSALAVVVFGGLAVLLAVRLLERPVAGMRRPVTPHITVAVCRAALLILGVQRRQIGRPMDMPGAMVANHASWLDIFVLNAAGPLYFVSKDDVASWFGIGWLARATGTVFVRRDARQARTQTAILEERLNADHRLLFFPEGTSTDGRQVIRFKTTLFEAFFSPGLKSDLHVQPVCVLYSAPPGRHPAYYGWWGDMEFGPHLLRVLATAPQGSVKIRYLEPLRISNYDNRKSLAHDAHAAVREAFSEGPLSGT